MIVHNPRHRPEPWSTWRSRFHVTLLPFAGVEWCCEWFAFVLSRWAFLEVLEYMGSFSILIAVIFYFSESGDRLKQKHYQAWQVINTAQGKGGSGGRVEALQELAQDGVPLVGVDVAGAFLQGIRLPRAQMVRSNLTAVDARNSDFQDTNFMAASLKSGNFRMGNLKGANLADTDLSDSDFCAATLSSANLEDASLDGADLGLADLKDARWTKIRSIRGASLQNVRNPPAGFLDWAAKNGADLTGAHSECK